MDAISGSDLSPDLGQPKTCFLKKTKAIQTFYPGPEAAKQPQTITLPPPSLNVGMMFFCVKSGVSLMPDVTGLKPSKKFSFCLISPENIFHKSLWDHQHVFGK